MAISRYKTGLIIKREYLSRIRNRTFLLSTFLLPLVYMLFIFGSALFSPDSPTTAQPQQMDIGGGLNYLIGLACGTLICFTIFIFGAMVMRGVKEEKVNRIAEIIISSVKPFELMMGKILGIAAVAFTQLLLWFILIFFLATASSVFLSHDVLQQAQHSGQSVQAADSVLAKLTAAKQSIAGINYGELIACFIFYFLGGFLFYASLFAAIGSAINEDSQDTQSLTLPITLPVFFSFIIMSSNLATPDNTIMVWASIIPFSSPVVMMARIAGGVPLWQLLLSISSLITGFLLTTWVAAKIYRTGILMYGKKSSWKEMLKWAFRK
jgi:ABC-2 type transport system permease protein